MDDPIWVRDRNPKNVSSRIFKYYIYIKYIDILIERLSNIWGGGSEKSILWMLPHPQDIVQWGKCSFVWQIENRKDRRILPVDSKSAKIFYDLAAIFYFISL